ncbi:MAG: ATP-binding protein [Pyrinomonadaceae bacterium MAG19_C2-C3]|nr:ATP-binding protein [Pyrinomonadaceae bacterium MAG19_C2-C3]
MRSFASTNIKLETDIGAARRAVNRFAAALGFPETDLSALDIVVQEIATNAVKYATEGGTLHFAALESVPHNNNASHTASLFAGSTALVPHPHAGIELVYLDKGPGIYDIARALSDGVSSGGSLGTGLGAVKRLTDDFDLYSMVATSASISMRTTAARRTNHGTGLLCRKSLPREHRASYDASLSSSSNDIAADTPPIKCGTWSRPYPGESFNGDAYFIKTEAETTFAAVIDGLGHGAGAYQASQEALRVLEVWTADEPLDALVFAVHERLRGTRGAVMSVVTIDHAHNRLTFAGVGNIQTRVFGTPAPVHLIPTNGTLGARLGKVSVWSHAWANGATLVMSSDGLSASWDITNYPQLLAHDPQLAAAILMRDFSRDSDDATVMVIIEKPEAGSQEPE